MRTVLILVVLSITMYSCSQTSGPELLYEDTMEQSDGEMLPLDDIRFPQYDDTSSPALFYDYTMEQMHNCYCPSVSMFRIDPETNSGFTSPGPGDWVRLYVENDVIVKAVRVSDNYELTAEEWKFFKSLKDLEDIIAEVDTTEYTVSLTFDPVDGYPSSVEIDARPSVNKYGDTVAVVMDAFNNYYNRNFSENR